MVLGFYQGSCGQISSGFDCRLWPVGRLLVDLRHLVLSSHGYLSSSYVRKQRFLYRISAFSFFLVYLFPQHRLGGLSAQLWVFGSRSPHLSNRFSGVIDRLSVNTWSLYTPGVVFLTFCAGYGGILVWWCQQNQPVFFLFGLVTAVPGAYSVWDSVSSALWCCVHAQIWWRLQGLLRYVLETLSYWSSSISQTVTVISFVDFIGNQLLWRQHGKSRHPRQQGEPHILVVFIKGREQ